MVGTAFKKTKQEVSNGNGSGGKGVLVAPVKSRSRTGESNHLGEKTGGWQLIGQARERIQERTRDVFLMPRWH